MRVTQAPALLLTLAALACGRVTSNTNSPDGTAGGSASGESPGGATGDAGTGGAPPVSEGGAPPAGGGGDVAQPECVDVQQSDLPGVELALTTPGCDWSRQQLNQGVRFEAELRVASSPGPLVAVDVNVALCARPTDDSGLIVIILIEGSGGRYCPTCDEGRCRRHEETTTPELGTYSYAFTTYGRAWGGPGTPPQTELEAPELPPGEYALRILAPGTIDGREFEVSVSREIRIYE